MSISSANWLKDARWGAFAHFIATPSSSISDPIPSIEQWNARVDDFETEGLAQQLEDAMVKYFSDQNHLFPPKKKYR